MPVMFLFYNLKESFFSRSRRTRTIGTPVLRQVRVAGCDWGLFEGPQIEVRGHGLLCPLFRNCCQDGRYERQRNRQTERGLASCRICQRVWRLDEGHDHGSSERRRPEPQAEGALDVGRRGEGESARNLQVEQSSSGVAGSNRRIIWWILLPTRLNQNCFCILANLTKTKRSH